MFFITTIYNNFKNLIIKYTVNKLLYGFKPNNNLNILIDLEFIGFPRLSKIKYNKANKAITFANIIVKANYNIKYKV